MAKVSMTPPVEIRNCGDGVTSEETADFHNQKVIFTCEQYVPIGSPEDASPQVKDVELISVNENTCFICEEKSCRFYRRPHFV